MLTKYGLHFHFSLKSLFICILLVFPSSLALENRPFNPRKDSCRSKATVGRLGCPCSSVFGSGAACKGQLRQKIDFSKIEDALLTSAIFVLRK
jgi:hypothetical protein